MRANKRFYAYAIPNRHPASAKGAAQDFIAHVIANRHPANRLLPIAQDLIAYIIPAPAFAGVTTRNPRYSYAYGVIG
jgi:hypothetical protein